MLTQAGAPKAPNTKSHICQTKGFCFLRISVLTHPKRQPPKAMSTDARAYLGGWRRSVRHEVIVMFGNELGSMFWIVTEGGHNL